MDKYFYAVLVCCKAKKKYYSSLSNSFVKSGEIFTEINWEIFHNHFDALKKCDWLKAQDDDDYIVLEAYPYRLTDVNFFNDFTKVSNEK